MYVSSRLLYPPHNSSLRPSLLAPTVPKKPKSLIRRTFDALLESVAKTIGEEEITHQLDNRQEEGKVEPTACVVFSYSSTYRVGGISAVVWTHNENLFLKFKFGPGKVTIGKSYLRKSVRKREWLKIY